MRVLTREVFHCAVGILLVAGCDDGPDDDIVESANENLTCPSSAAAQASLPTGLGTVAPAQVGTIESNFDVSANGRAIYRVPLVAPPGVDGMAPQLSISYDSTSPEASLGMGFSLGGLSTITRCPLTYARDATVRGVKYDNMDALCLDGVRLVKVGSTPVGPEYRTFPDQRVRVIAHLGVDQEQPLWFEVYDLDGTIREIGNTNDSRVLGKSDVGVTPPILSWWISKRSDRHDNWIRYYYENSGYEGSQTLWQFYPTKIEYGGHGGLPTRRIAFDYETWNAHPRSLLAGKTFLRNKRVSAVRMLLIASPETLVRSYGFTYGSNPATSRAQLLQIKECAPNGICKPPTKLGWISKPNAPFIKKTPVTGAIGEAYAVADVNGDGLEDLVYSNAATHPLQTLVALSQGGGAFASPTVWRGLPFNGGTPIDWNHDGRMDILTTEIGNPNYVAWLAQPNNTFTPEDTVIPDQQPVPIDGTNKFINLHTHRLHVVDFNADGLSDIAVCYDQHDPHYDSSDWPPWRIGWGTPTGIHEVRTYVDTPDGTPPELAHLWCGMSVKFVDVDSDSKVDILTPDIQQFTNKLKLLQFTPSGRPGYNDPGDPTRYVVPGTWSASTTNLPDIEGDSTNEPAFIDVNGDGNVDMVRRGSGGLETRINNGRSFEPPITGIAGAAYLQLTDLRWGRPVDWNGDGSMDLLVWVGVWPAGNWRVLQSSVSGTGTFTATDLAIDDDDLVVTSVSGTSHSDLITFDDDAIRVHQHGELNGLLNTITDGMNSTDPSSPNVIPNVTIWYDALIDVGRQKNLAAGSSAEDQARYVGDWSYDPNDATYPRGALVGPIHVVSQYGFHNGVNGTRWFDVRYRNGRYDALADGSLGFGAKITHAFDTAETNVQIYDNETKLDRSYPLAGILKRTLEWSPALATQDDSDELIMSQSEYEYSFPSIAPGTFLVAPTRIEDWRYEGIWDPAGEGHLRHVSDQMTPAKQTSHTRIDHMTRDAFGNVTKEIQTTYGVDTTTTTRQFANDGATWLIARPTFVSTKSEANGETQIVEESTSYTAKGDPWVVTRSIPSDPTASRSTTLTYDDFGNVVKTSVAAYGAAPRTACTTYDGAGLYAVASRNAYEHTTYARHDPGTGVVTAVRDANGLDTRHEIDGFGRLTRTLHVDGTESKIERSLVTNAGPTSNWRAQKVRTYRNGTSDTTVFYDMLGRTIRTETKGPDVEACEMGVCMPSPRYAEVNEYDKLGNLHRASRPFLTAAPASQLTYEVTDFDTLGRPWRIVTPWNKTINYAYEGNKKTVTTSEGDLVTQLDAAGRIASVRDRKGGLTKYTYGPFGNPRTIDAVGSVTSITTDALGRSTVVVDPDRGKSTVTYNGFDEPTERIDALFRSVKYKFDLLGRRTEVIAGEGTSTWKYDPSGCKGCVDRSETSAGVSRVFAYDSMTRAKSSTLTVDGVGYTVTTTYDAWSRPSIITYPTVGAVAGARVKLHYSTNGRVRKVTDDLATTTYFDAKRYDGSGNLTKSTLGTDVTVERTYDHHSGALDTLKSSTSAVLIQNLVYEQDDRLNMKWRQDLKFGQQEHFEYDVLDRLWCQKWNRESPGCIVEVQYDDNGNIRSKSDVGTYTYNPVRPHAVAVAGPRFYDYNAVGNQTRRPGIDQIDYTSFDLPSRYQLALGGGEIKFDYDADLNRVRKTTATEKKTYVGDMYERVQIGSSDQHRYYVPVGDARLVITKAAAQSTTIHYSLPDGMGSAEVIVNPSGGVVERRSYDAWGARRELTWANPPAVSYTFGVTEASFTGHEQDDEVGLVNMKGRIYDPKLARFVQPDPHTQSPYSSQVWNRYSYALNNPLRYTDPTGFDAVDSGLAPVPEGERPSATALPPIGMDPMIPTGAASLARAPVIGDQATPLPELPPPTGADGHNRFASVPGETTSPFAPDEANGIANDTSSQNNNAQPSNDGIGGLGLALVGVSSGAARAGTAIRIGAAIGAGLALIPPVGLAVIGGLVVGGIIGYSIPLTSDPYPNKTDVDAQSTLSALRSGGLALEIARKAMKASGYGSIYLVPAPFTKRMTHNYVGRNNTPFASMFRSSSDGRDRRKAVTVRYYDLNNPQEGRRLEQVFINRHGGLRCTDNDRDEIREELWETSRVPPPLPGCFDWLQGVPGAPPRP